jgi:hypothetical protein
MAEPPAPGGADGSIEQWLIKLLVLLPGFISLGLARYLGACGDLGDLELTLFSLGLSLLIFLSASLVHRGGAWTVAWYRRATLRLPPWRFVPAMSTVFVSLVLLLSVSFGLALAFVYDSDAIILAARRAGPDRLLTKRSSTRTLPFLLTLNRQYKFMEADARHRENQAYLEVTLKTGERFAGKAVFFGIDKEASDIFLSRACTIDKGQPQPIEGPGVFIPAEVMKFVLFLDRTNNQCNDLWSKRELLEKVKAKVAERPRAGTPPP